MYVMLLDGVANPRRIPGVHALPATCAPAAANINVCRAESATFLTSSCTDYLDRHEGVTRMTRTTTTRTAPRPPKKPLSAAPDAPALSPGQLDRAQVAVEEIARRAYELYEARGGAGGHELED